MAKSTTTPSRKRTTKKKNTDTPDLPKTNGPSVPADLSPSEEEIRLRAYHRYLERGGRHGADFEDWLQAEKDLKSSRHN